MHVDFFTKAVIWVEQDHMQNYRLLKFRSKMEDHVWVCDDAVDDHVCISSQEAKVLEALQYDTESPRIVQSAMLFVLGTNEEQQQLSGTMR